MLVNLMKSCYGEVSSQTYSVAMGLRYVETEDVVNVTGELCNHPLGEHTASFGAPSSATYKVLLPEIHKLELYVPTDLQRLASVVGLIYSVCLTGLFITVLVDLPLAAAADSACITVSDCQLKRKAS